MNARIIGSVAMLAFSSCSSLPLVQSSFDTLTGEYAETPAQIRERVAEATRPITRAEYRRAYAEAVWDDQHTVEGRWHDSNGNSGWVRQSPNGDVEITDR